MKWYLVEFDPSTLEWTGYGPFDLEVAVTSKMAARAKEAIGDGSMHQIRVGKFQASSLDDAFAQAQSAGMSS